MLLSNARATFVLQCERVPPASFSHKLLKIPTVLDRLFQWLDQFIWNIDRKAATFITPIQRITRVPLARLTEFAALSNTGALS